MHSSLDRVLQVLQAVLLRMCVEWAVCTPTDWDQNAADTDNPLLQAKLGCWSRTLIDWFRHEQAHPQTRAVPGG